MQSPREGKQQTRGAALQALGRDERLRLAAWANICARRCGVAGAIGQDLLQAAYERWLRSDKPIGGTDETCRYLMGAIRSLASNAVRDASKDAMAHCVEPEDDAEDRPPDATAIISESARSAQASEFAQAMYDRLSDDAELQLLILHLAQETPRREIQQELGWNDKKYDAVQKRRIRAAARLIREGKA